MTRPDRPVRVLLVEDDPDFADAVRAGLPDHMELTVTTTVAAARRQGAAFDAALVDLGLPDGDGVDVIRDLTAQNPVLAVVVLTVQRSDAQVLRAFRAGAQGYLLKEHLGDRLGAALAEALDGGSPMSAPIARRLLALVRSLPEPAVPLSGCPELTGRELEVLRSFSEGLSYAQSAATLGMSLNTLRTHVRSIYEKLAVGSRTHAVMSALQLGLLQVNDKDPRRVRGDA